MPDMRLLIRPNRPAFLMAWLLLAAVIAQAQTDLPIFTDGLDSGFQDWSWLPRNLTNTSPVHSGNFSIKVSPPANPRGGPALWFRRADLDTAAYASITFWANGGESGGQLLQLRSMLGTDAQTAYPLPPLPANEWRQFMVPLALLNAQDKTNFQGIWFQLRGADQMNPFFLDDIQLTARPGIAPLHPASAGVSTRAAESSWNIAIWCIAGALIAITGLLTWLILMLRRSGLGTSMALVPMPSSSLQQISLGPGAEPRAIPGAEPRLLEASTDPQVQTLRDKMAAELAEFAKRSLVQGLYSQRGKLIEAQQMAQAELAELETRLASLHLPLQERIQVYEQRIGDLEKELETRDEEMRNLIHATLLLVRERLEEEKAKEPGVSRFN